ncbi:hypothetical protein ACQ859_04095 [Roseateles chitinivorans]|uniref:hypothetical protein n=1 Tax=Roseateles chitinivorans TaxID=2917965 RepID=UPI003D673F09
MAAFSPQDRVALAAAVAGALMLHAGVMGALSERPLPQAVDTPAIATRVIEARPAPPPRPRPDRPHPWSLRPS